MFIILMLILGIRVLYSDMKKIPKRDHIEVKMLCVLYLFLMFYYVSYINNLPFSYGYGIPGADMLQHFLGATALASGSKWTDLAIIATRFEKVGISTIGYFLYTSFIALCIYFPPVFSVGFNIYLIYVFQILISLDTCLKFAILISSEYKTVRTIQIFTILALCVPYIVQASQLMRDVYYMWAIVSCLSAIQQHRWEQGRPGRGNGDKFFKLKVSFFFILSVVIRYYSFIVLVPLICYYSGKERLAVYITMAEVMVLLVGTNIVNFVKIAVGLPWNITAPDIAESIKFLLFPNIFNQSSYLWHWTQQFGTTIDVSGCNVPGVYYMMAVWNLYTFPLILIGICTQWKHKKREIIIWTGILLSVVMLYSITYDSIDTRHKFFMSLPMCVLSAKGAAVLQKYIPLVLYKIFIFMAVVFILFAAI